MISVFECLFSVYLSVSSGISKTTCPNFTKFSVCLLLLTVVRSFFVNNVTCISAFVGDIMFSHNVAYAEN